MNPKLWITKIAEKNDPLSFRALFDHYYDKLLRMARYFTKSDVLAEDIVLDVFAKLWKSRKTLTEVDHMDHFLYTAVKRKSMDYLKAENRHQSIPLDPTVEPMYDSNPERKILYKEFEAVVNAAIGLLSPKCRLVYKMAKEDKLKYKEIASLLNISEKTVEFHTGRALEQIRQSLNQYLSASDIQAYMERLAMVAVGGIFF